MLWVSMAAVRTILYGCLLLSLAGFLAQQCHQLASLYVSEQTALIRSMESAGTRSVPGLTVCPGNQLQTDVLANWSMLKLHKNREWIDWNSFPENKTKDQLWTEAAVNLNDLVSHCGTDGMHCAPRGPRGGPGIQKGHWTLQPNQRGVCYTLRLDAPMDMEEPFILNFRHNAMHPLSYESSKVDVFLHGDQTPVVEGGRWLHYRILIPHPHITLRPGDFVRAEAKGELEVALSLRRRPCESERRYSYAYCRQQCERRLHAKGFGCRSPWMPGPAEDSCTSKDPVGLHSFQVSIKKIHEQCLCKIGCTREKWIMTQTEQFSDFVPKNSSSLQMRWAERVSVNTEQLTYGSSSLLSDIGGFIGILFGVSILGLVHMMEDWLKKVLCGRRWRRGQKQTPQQQTRSITGEPRDAWSSPGIKQQDDLPGFQSAMEELENDEEKPSDKLRETNLDSGDLEYFQVV